MNNISFGAKIPIALCQIKNAKTNEPTSATIYEYDCKDPQDVWEIERINSKLNWYFANNIGIRADLKYQGCKSYQNNGIYSIEDINGKTICLCCTEEYAANTKVKFIETKTGGKYKYAGQAMLAAIAKRMLTNQKQRKMIISNAQEGAFGFYEKCGFHEDNSEAEYKIINYQMPRKEMPFFIRKTEEKTQGGIINLDM